MPAKTIKPEELFTAWSKAQYKPVYLFTGAEDYLIEEAVNRITAIRLPDNDDTSRDRLDAENESVGEILQAAQTVPFFGEHRLVIVRNTGKLASEEQKALAAGIAALPPTTQLILIWGKEWRRDDAERPLVEACARAGAVVIFWPLYPDSAQRWLQQRSKIYHKTIRPDAAGWLIQEAGEGLRRLDQELSKVCVYIGDRAEVTREDVEACFGYEKALSPFEWLTAVKQKKTAQSMLTLRRLLDDDEEPLKLLAMATYAVRDEVRETDSQSERLSYCIEAHQSIKTGQETPAMALTLLTLRLCGLQTLNTAG